MSVTWSGDGPELLLSLDRSDGRPLGHQLQDQLRAAVRDGRLRASERLPSTRRLAEDLGVSRGMVVACYEQLVAEGYLVGSAGSGTRVADGVAEPARASRHAGSAVPVEASRRPVDVDFEYGVPDLRSAPLPDWLWALREAGRNAPTAMMGTRPTPARRGCGRSWRRTTAASGPEPPTLSTRWSSTASGRGWC